MTFPESLTAATGAFTCLTLTAGVFSAIAGGAHSKLGELQLARTPDEARAMLQQLPPEGPKRLRNQLAFDYAFLGCYWFVFIGLAMLLARRGGIGFDLPALGIALGGTATAVVDVLENLRTAGLVSSAGPDPHVRLQPIRHLRATSRLKWILSSSTLALVAVLFFAGSGWAVMVGVALLLTAGIGVIAAATGSAMLIKGYLLLFLLFGAVVAVWLTGWPANAYFHLS